MTNIYCLKESGIDRVEYVGRTELSLASRLRDHLREATVYDTSKKHKWIADVLSRGGNIEIVILDVCAKHEREEIEERWIQYYRSINPDLKNVMYAQQIVFGGDMSDRIRSGLVEEVEERVDFEVMKSTIVLLRRIYGFTNENRMEVLDRLVKQELERLENASS